MCFVRVFFLCYTVRKVARYVNHSDEGLKLETSALNRLWLLIYLNNLVDDNLFPCYVTFCH